ncbi:GMC family oxidoreductase [Falsiroseomonas ponticola]|uniref:GMC family oxidoreductase n=1 Tax=Falsiroseomonas ponticola TaxID=2786951 RepID=UPI0019335446|nr:GMC family oxidoreductase [Roseomonas ponticola]
MARKLPETDVVIVGMGWTGGIMAKELAEAGMKVTVLERGAMRRPEEDFQVPRIRDELRFSNRTDLMMNTAQDTLTIRNTPDQEALPMRRLGSFLPGEGVGGAGSHWNGVTWRWGDMELQIRSKYEEKYGRAYIPEDMTIQDWGVTYAELEPYYDKFEKVAGVSGKAGNLRGQRIRGGNVFEDARANEFPLPPLEDPLSGVMFAAAAREMGYNPHPRPSANASRPYTNPDGARLGACQYCGFCERYGCESNAKGSPNVTVIPAALRNPNVTLRTHSWVLRVNKDSDGRKATGVTYVNMLNGEELEQPAGMVILGAYGLNNAALLMWSGIGEVYNPSTGEGLVGKNYCYQTGTGATLFFEDKFFNPFIATGSWGQNIDDFNTNWEFDRRPHNYIGGSTIAAGGSNGRPIEYRPLPAGTPRWGTEWKRATRKWYQGAMSIGSSGSVMPNRANFLDLDPTYRNVFGQPLMRMTFEYKPNEVRMTEHVAGVINRIAATMGAASVNAAGPRRSWSAVPYQSTHNTGGTIMGRNPRESVVNKYLQHWQLHNLFVLGAGVFPHNAAYNPTGPVGALAYWAADAIKTRYARAPGPLVPA